MTIYTNKKELIDLLYDLHDFTRYRVNNRDLLTWFNEKPETLRSFTSLWSHYFQFNYFCENNARRMELIKNIEGFAKCIIEYTDFSHPKIDNDDFSMSKFFVELLLAISGNGTYKLSGLLYSLDGKHGKDVLITANLQKISNMFDEYLVDGYLADGCPAKDEITKCLKSASYIKHSYKCSPYVRL